MNTSTHSRTLLPVLALGISAALGWAGEEATNQTLATLRGTIVEAETGQLAPCTVTIVDASGRTVLERESFKRGFRSDGHFEKRLPPGKTRVRVTRGFETVATEQDVALSAGATTDVRFELRRVVNLRRRGWYAGDNHAHMLHGEKTIAATFDDVANAARAEDLQYLSLAQAWSLENPTPERLEAALKTRSKPDCLLTWNLETPKNYYRGDAGRCLGHCWTLGMRGRTERGEDAIPLLLQASAHDYEIEKQTFANFESHALIHALGGAVFYTHPARWWTGPWGGQAGYPKQEKMRVSNMAVELPLDTLIGPTFDGLDILTGSGEFKANALAFDLWCLLLNHGYRVAATASSDACFDRPGGATPGVSRTYTWVDGDFALPAVTRATARGATFVTSGPLLLVSLKSKPPGSVLKADGQPQNLSIEAWASGTDTKGLTKVEVLRNGKPFQNLVISPPRPAMQTNLTLTESTDAWYCVRAFGSDAQRQQAISGAFFFQTQSRRPPEPVPARVSMSLVDATTWEGLSGTVREVEFLATLTHEGKAHPVTGGQATVTIPGKARLRAEVPGYEPLTLSPFPDDPALLEAITQLSAEDLTRWETFERIKARLENVRLVFRMKRVNR